ncbi:MAG: sugar phosphate isomerase/epimerase [Treponema sp.]|nr:sugar phosphate isomerase/epimerase [Treponema sp.]
MSKISNFKQLLIIPSAKSLNESIELSKEYNTGFEFNDFAMPWMLENEKGCSDLISKYLSTPELPSFTTTHGAFFDVLVFSDDIRIREVSEMRVYQSMDAARKLGCKGIVFHGNINPLLLATAAGPIYEKHWLESSRDFFRTVCRDYPEINIYIENMWDQTPDHLQNLAKEMTDLANFGLCFDYAHAGISKTDTEEWSKKLGPYIKHVHINDNDGKSDLHLALGDGITDWNKFFELKYRFFNDASVLIETSSIENQRKSLKFLNTL